jgi:hypothetical protein
MTEQIEAIRDILSVMESAESSVLITSRQYDKILKICMAKLDALLGITE